MYKFEILFTKNKSKIWLKYKILNFIEKNNTKFHKIFNVL